MKYVLYESDNGLSPLINEEAMGNAWFVDSIIKVESADQALESFISLDFNNQIIVEDDISLNALLTEGDTKNANIKLITNTPNKLEYVFEGQTDQTIVFSEIYYPNGWQAKIDGKTVEHYRANYILRALTTLKGG